MAKKITTSINYHLKYNKQHFIQYYPPVDNLIFKPNLRRLTDKVFVTVLSSNDFTCIFAGNAIKVLGIKNIQIRGRDGETVLGNVHMDIHPEWKRLQQAFLDELDGRKIPAGAHFLTEIDLEAGEIAREKFKRVFASYMK